MRRRVVLTAGMVATVAGVTSSARGNDEQYRILVFSKTAAYRHESIPAGIAALRALGDEHDFGVDATEDASAFSEPNLVRYAVVVFLSTSGTVLDTAQRAAFESYIGGGKGFVGIHGAADTEYDWPFYGDLVGAYFLQHPHIQRARVVVEDRSHVATAHLGPDWTRTDEWYSFRTNPRRSVRVLASLDESSYTGGGMGDHPITWCREVAGGRSFYTGFGHTVESFGDDDVRTLLHGGIRWAAGLR